MDGTMKHLPLREMGYAVVVVVLLAAIYLGSYFAMVKRGARTNWSYSPPPGEEMPPLVYPRYRWNLGVVAFFAPAHAIDRRLRPGYWSDLAQIEAAIEELQELTEEGRKAILAR